DGQAYIQTSHVQGTTYLWKKVYTTANTTVASDGSIKAASPVARIVQSKEANRRTDLYEDGFSWCGCGTANEEAEGIQLSRLDVGVYLLTGSAGLASSGWQLLPPMDPGGMGELGVVEAEQTESGGLTVRLFKRKYMLNDEGEIVKTKGAPMDVPSNSWIDVRLDMPENSVWNQRQKAAVDAAENESGS
ncbi:TPA: phage tail protein, partial [Enterobacter cloacae]